MKLIRIEDQYMRWQSRVTNLQCSPAYQIIVSTSPAKPSRNTCTPLQAMAALQEQLRHARFELYASSPRMLPRMYNPLRLDVDCSNKTPAKAAPAKRGRSVAATGVLVQNLLSA